MTKYWRLEMAAFLNFSISIVSSLFKCRMYGKIKYLSLSLSLSLSLYKCNYLHVTLFEGTSAHYDHWVLTDVYISGPLKLFGLFYMHVYPKPKLPLQDAGGIL